MKKILELKNNNNDTHFYYVFRPCHVTNSIILIAKYPAFKTTTSSLH